MKNMSDPYNILGRFELSKSDGVHCCQVLAYNSDDVEYWKEQARKNGYLMAFDHHTSQGAMFANEKAFDTYQIFPPEQAHKFSGVTIIEL